MNNPDFQRALGAYRDRLRRDPRDVDALNRLGNLLSGAGQLAASQSAFERALALRPDIAQLRFNLGNLLQRRGDYAAARDSFTRAVAL